MNNAISNDVQQRLQWSLLFLRLGVFIVMIMWTLDKFINPEHSALIFEKFYGVNNSSEILTYTLGTIQTILVISFLAGIKKRITYGIILVLHSISTLSSYNQYLDGFNNLLFFTAWPMLAACFTLYILRDQDIKFTVTH
ncbi:MAG: hypothetical protein WBH20_12255 [Oceanisphaera sp.]